MPIDESYQFTRHAYRCSICKRYFESESNWAWQAVRECEAECTEKAKEELVRVFLPPPGRYDGMFRDKYWTFVKKGSPQEACAREGHEEKRYWADSYPRTKRDPQTRVLRVTPREVEHVCCTRCAADVVEFGGCERDA